MAKYTIKYCCGHGSYEKQLYGPNADRHSYIAWAEQHKLCPDCYKAKVRAEDAAADPVATLHTSDVRPILTCIVRGKTEANRQALYDLGFSWERVATGALGFLEIGNPPLSLAIIKTVDSLAEGHAWAMDLQRKLEALGYTLTFGANPLELRLFTKAVLEREAALAAYPKPERPDWYKAIWDKSPPNARWNGRFYGRPGRWSIYVADVQYRLTDAQKSELDTYQSQLAAYRKAQETA